MQEKLADMKSKFLTRVAIRVKPASEPAEGEESGELFNILNSAEMGLAKQIVLNDFKTQLVAAADVITQPSDTQADFYDQALATKV